MGYIYDTATRMFRREKPAQTIAVGPSRKNIAKMRTIQAAGTGRLEAGWSSQPTTIDAWIYQHLSTLVARSREVAINNDHAKKFKQLVRDNVAGPNGFEMQAQVKDPNGKPDTLASTAIEDAFYRFSKRGTFDVTNTQSRTQFERLMVQAAAVNGEFIAVARYGTSLNEFGFAVQAIDPVLLDPQHFETLRNGNHIRHGIEMDANGKPVNYWFKRYDERQVGYIKSHSGPTYDIVPADNVCHLFLCEEVGQKRGLPWMTTALWRMRMLGGFEDAALVNARVGASKMGFFRDPEGDTEEEIPMDGDPGTFDDIGSREFVPWTPQFPEQTIDPFTKSMLRSIASGLNVSYNNLASDLTSVNFSSIRQGALDEREVWKGLQQFFVDGWCDWLYNKWLERALLAQAITVSGKPLKFERLEKYRSVIWQARRWAWIDPQSEVAANEKAIAMRIKSRSEVIRETTSRDPVDVWDEIQREDDELSKRNILPIATPGSPAMGTDDSKPTDEPTDPEGAAKTGDVQGTALNGAQVQALADLANKVAMGELPASTAKAIAAASFPLISPATLADIFDGLESFEPAKPEQPVNQPTQQPPQQPK